ncbi:MAG: ferritin [Bacteroidales bacterium]|nr:ferritin [Bacteroidales bacterium]
MQNAINKQINAELWSAYLYLAMSMDAEAKALKGVANWFFVQWLEEQDHARIFQNYMNSIGAKVVLHPIDKVAAEWDNPLEMFKQTLEHEKEVTEMIKGLVRLAVSEEDFTTLSRLQWFVDEQREEEENARDLVDDFSRAGDDFGTILELDSRLKEREHSKPEPLK